MSHDCLPLSQSTLTHLEKVLVIEDVLNVDSVLPAEVEVLGETRHQVSHELRVHPHRWLIQQLLFIDLIFEDVETGLHDDGLCMEPIVIGVQMHVQSQF